MKYVLGVDGGGSKTHVALYNTECEQIDFFEWGPTNHEVLNKGFDSLSVEINKIIESVCKRNKINIYDIEVSVFGLAGVDTKYQYEKIYKFLDLTGLKRIRLCNDAYLGIKAGSKKGYGICSVNGTGSIAAGIDKTGHQIQIGGLGIFTGDVGGGYFIGAAAIRAVYEYLFKCGEYTIIKDILFDLFNIYDKNDFMDAVLLMSSEGYYPIKELNKVVYDAADKKDKVAINLLKNAGNDMVKCILGVLSELDFTSDDAVNVILAGSLHVKEANTLILDTIKNKLKEVKYKLIYSKLNVPPVNGAVIWALNDIGVKDAYERVSG